MTDPRDSTQTTFRSVTFGQIFGGILLLAGIALLIVDAVVLHEAVTWPDIALHGIVFGLAWALLYPNRFQAFVSSVKDKIPGNV